ncbi:hypothetical protein M885DRAFT_547749 [Pelagophyceae sp. CCMP2097]|nr:hypothetical protein M885DRAFT_547749 [Pelagophyceae sp. CCMP2097]
MKYLLLSLVAAATAQPGPPSGHPACLEEACSRELNELCARRRSLLSVLQVTLVVEDDADAPGTAADFIMYDGAVDCLFASYDVVSPKCRAALDERESMPPPPPPPCMMATATLALAAVLIAATFVKARRGARRGAARKIFDALHADPQLKALVEAAAGVAVPAPTCASPRCAGARCGVAVAAVVCLSLFAFGPFATLLAAALCATIKLFRGACCRGAAPAAEAADVEAAAPAYCPPKPTLYAAAGCAATTNTAAVCAATTATNTAAVCVAQTATNTTTLTQTATNTEAGTPKDAATQDPPAYVLLV